MAPDDPSRRDAIVASAIEVLDADGLDGLSMRRLAQRTGFSATSVYWYVSGREELVSLTLDAVVAEIELAEFEPDGWREAAAAMAHGFRAMVLRHPWVGLVAASYPGASGRRMAKHSEHLLAIYEAAGFAGEAADHALGSVYSFVLGAAVGEAGVRAWRPGSEEDGSVGPTVEEMERAREAAEGLPRMTSLLASLEGVDMAARNDAAFAFGLDVVLDGLESRRNSG